MASPAGGDPVLPVGAGGVSWAVLRGRKGRRRWGGSLALGKGQFVSGMGRGRVDGSCCASVLGAPLRVRELLENETKPPRKVLCAYSKPGSHSEYTPRSWRQFSPRDDNVPVCLAPHKGLPVISLVPPPTTLWGRHFYMVPNFPSGNREQINMFAGHTAEKG